MIGLVLVMYCSISVLNDALAFQSLTVLPYTSSRHPATLKGHLQPYRLISSIQESLDEITLTLYPLERFWEVVDSSLFAYMSH